MTSATGFILQPTRPPPEDRSLHSAIASVLATAAAWKNALRRSLDFARQSHHRVLRRVGAQWKDRGRFRRAESAARDRIFPALYFRLQEQDPGRGQPQK